MKRSPFEKPLDVEGRELTEETGYTADHIERVFSGPPSAASSTRRFIADSS